MKSTPPALTGKAPSFVELAPLELPSVSNFEADALRRLLDTLEARR